MSKHQDEFGDEHQLCNCCGWEGHGGVYFDETDTLVCYNCIRELFLENIKEMKELHLGICGQELMVGEKIQVTRSAISEKDRDEIFAKDDYKCKHCGSSKDLTIDHIVPFSKNGRFHKSNFQTLCKSCNSRKSNKITSFTSGQNAPDNRAEGTLPRGDI